MCWTFGSEFVLQFLLDKEAQIWQSVPPILMSIMKYHIRKVYTYNTYKNVTHAHTWTIEYRWTLPLRMVYIPWHGRLSTYMDFFITFPLPLLSFSLSTRRSEPSQYVWFCSCINAFSFRYRIFMSAALLLFSKLWRKHYCFTCHLWKRGLPDLSFYNLRLTSW